MSICQRTDTMNQNIRSWPLSVCQIETIAALQIANELKFVKIQESEIDPVVLSASTSSTSLESKERHGIELIKIARS